MNRRRLALAIAFLAITLAFVHDGPPAGADEAAARGMKWDGLSPGPRCPGAYELRTRDGATFCSHGPDPAPRGHDVRVRRTPAATTESTAGETAAGSVPCIGDGTSGPRVQAVYAATAGTDRFSTVAPNIRSWAASADAVFDGSASETGGSRHVRWVHDASCNIVVAKALITSTDLGSFDRMISALRAQGFNASGRKYLVWAESNVYCGIASILNDDRPGSDNSHNSTTLFGRIDNGCWGLSGNSLEAHELMHTIGGVQQSAPNATTGWHCTDESDRMCYNDGSGQAMRNVCASTHENRFDCGHNDYFHTAPASGTYLATHWNAANSVFLSAGGTAPPPTTTPTTPTTKTSTFSGTGSKTFLVTVGTGSVTARLEFTGANLMTVKFKRSGTIYGSLRGPSPVVLTRDLKGGTYKVAVVGVGTFKLTVTYPAP